VPVVAGAGDQAAGAVGAAASSPARPIAIGTSGVVFTTTKGYSPEKPDAGTPSPRHSQDLAPDGGDALRPGFAGGTADTCAPASTSGELCAEPPAHRSLRGADLPAYLTGERTPLCDPRARGLHRPDPVDDAST